MKPKPPPPSTKRPVTKRPPPPSAKKAAKKAAKKIASKVVREIPSENLDDIEFTDSAKTLAAVWGPGLDQHGFTRVSNFFLDNYSRLLPPVTHGQAMFIVHLIRHKWTSDAPFPSLKSIASRMGVSDKSTRRYALELEEKKYLKRAFRVSRTSRYHLDGLFVALRELDKNTTKPKKRARR